MQTLKLSRFTKWGVAATLALAGSAMAAPVAFDVRSSSFSPDSGYGSGSSSLDVDFNANNIRRTFDLLNGGSQTFAFGTISFNETDIASAETNNLGVSATFNFDDPLNSNRTVTASGVATVGAANDSGVDFRIDWADLDVSFVGGTFRISMNDLSFTGNTTLTQNFTITLLSGGAPVTGNAVPEPATLALVGGALLLAGVRRRRQA